MCPGCGHPKSLTHDEANAARYRGGLIQCMACAARDDRRASDHRAGEPLPGGYYIAIDREDEA